MANVTNISNKLSGRSNAQTNSNKLNDKRDANTCKKTKNN